MSKIEFFIELNVYEADQIHRVFRRADECLKQLIEKRYLRRSGNEYQFFFVGLIQFESSLVVILPKYVQQIVSYEKGMEEAVRMIRVLRKISLAYFQLPDFENISYELRIYNEISLADSLIRDYIDNGLLRLKRTEVVENGLGTINWERTVATLTPVFSKGRPFYLDIISDDTGFTEIHLVTEIHKWVLKKVVEKYGRILGYELSDSDFYNVDTTIPIDDAHIKSVLLKELQSSYVDRNVVLLRQLYAFIDKSFVISSNKAFYLFGTGYFHTVWEQVCKVTFSDQMQKYQQLLARPMWVDITGNANTSETLRPDILCSTKELDLVTFVFDTKYYNFKFNEIPGSGVQDNPGIGDVSKQFLYKMLIEKITEGAVINAFLFPTTQVETITFIGHVEFPVFADSKVLLFSLSATSFFDAFITDTKLGVEWLPYIHQNAADRDS